jgi:hypothetical protein
MDRTLHWTQLQLAFLARFRIVLFLAGWIPATSESVDRLVIWCFGQLVYCAIYLRF